MSCKRLGINDLHFVINLYIRRDDASADDNHYVAQA
jgi:hypothetical protein